MELRRWPIGRSLSLVAAGIFAFSVLIAVVAFASERTPGHSWRWLVLAFCALSGVLAAPAVSALGRRITAQLVTIQAEQTETTGHDVSTFAGLDQIRGQIASLASDLEAATTQVGIAAGETARMFTLVEGTAGSVSQNIQVISVGAQQMGASNAQIAENAREAARVATGAVQSVESTTETMNALGDSSRQIGDVVRLITSIAEQTNLLALNATIEAARAGSAGRGFAVVADEVKQLAQETARATQDISQRVEAIQQDAEQAAQSISDVADVIMRMSTFQSTIASSVGEQTATTALIGERATEAAESSGQIARIITERAVVASAAVKSMNQSRQNIHDLGALGDELG